VRDNTTSWKRCKKKHLCPDTLIVTAIGRNQLPNGKIHLAIHDVTRHDNIIGKGGIQTMKRTVKEKAILVFFIMSISIFHLAIFDAYGFDRQICNNNHSTLLNACYDKSGDYGYDGTAKPTFNSGCSQAATTVLRRCYSETACSAFRSFLNVPGNTCNSLSPAAKKDGCFEMYNQWTHLYDVKNFSPCPY
jgi:hypothetical protein